jgi:hypothetical protein
MKKVKPFTKTRLLTALRSIDIDPNYVPDQIAWEMQNEDYFVASADENLKLFLSGDRSPDRINKAIKLLLFVKAMNEPPVLS